jgi:hypothetical protein
LKSIVLQPLFNPFSATQKTIESDSWMTLYPQGRNSGSVVIGARLMAETGSQGLYAIENYRPQDDGIFQTFVTASSSRYWTFDQFQSGVLTTVGIEQVQMWTGSAENPESWTIHQTLTSTVPVSGTRFGYSMAMSEDGNTLVIGEPGDLTSAVETDDFSAYTFHGQAHIYKRVGGTWTNVYTRSSDSLCGTSVDVSVDGSVVVIGEPYSLNPDTLQRDGAICVLTASGASSYVLYQEVRNVLSSSYINSWFHFSPMTWKKTYSDIGYFAPWEFSTGDVVKISKDAKFFLCSAYSDSSPSDLSTIIAFSKSAAGYVQKTNWLSAANGFSTIDYYDCFNFGINRTGDRIFINGGYSLTLSGNINSSFAFYFTSSNSVPYNLNTTIADVAFLDNDNIVTGQDNILAASGDACVFLVEKNSSSRVFLHSSSGTVYQALSSAFGVNGTSSFASKTGSNIPYGNSRYAGFSSYITKDGAPAYVTGNLGSIYSYDNQQNVVQGPVNKGEIWLSFDGFVGGQHTSNRSPYKQRQAFGKRLSYISGGYLLVADKPGVGTDFTSAQLFRIPSTVTSQSYYSKQWIHLANEWNFTVLDNAPADYLGYDYWYPDRNLYITSTLRHLTGNYYVTTSSYIVAQITASYDKLPTTFELLNTFTHNDEYLLATSADLYGQFYEHLTLDSIANYHGNVIAQGVRSYTQGYDTVAEQFTTKWQDDRTNYKVVGGQKYRMYRDLNRGATSLTSWNPLDLSASVWWRNTSGSEGSLSSVVDDSGNGSHMIVNASTSRQPRGIPERAGINWYPAIRLDSVSQAYAQASGSVGDLPEFHKENFTIIYEGIVYPSTSAQCLLGTWGGSTSNQNSISVESTANQGLQFYILSQTGGGSTHLNRSTANNSVRPGDHITLVWRRSGTSSRIYIHRRPRFPGDSDSTITHDDTISGTPSSGNGASVLTVGSYIGLASGFMDQDISDLIVLDRSITDQELTNFQSWADSRYDFGFISYTSSRPLIINTDLGVSAGGGADNLHPNDSGHSKIGNCMWDNDKSLAMIMNLSGVVRVATCGDSRMDGYNSSGTPTTGRAVRASLATLSASYTDTPVGPASAAKGGVTFALSGLVEREDSRMVSSKGWSYRTPGTNSVDVYMGPSGSYRDVDIAHFLLGVNNLGSGVGSYMIHDIMYERLQTILYMKSQVEDATNHSIGISLLTEPSSATTTTGFSQRMAFAINRELHALVQKLRSLGIPVAISNLHDDTYYP